MDARNGTEFSDRSRALKNKGSDRVMEGYRHGRVQEEEGIEIGDKGQNNLTIWLKGLSEQLSKEPIPKPKLY